MKRLVILGLSCLALLFGPVKAYHGQKINRKQPSVYLAFKEFVDKTPDLSYPSQAARLILHNNTRWPIYYIEHYDPTVSGAQISYIIELEDGRRDERMYVDVVMSGKVMPGKMLTFVVPREDFPKGSQIYITFSFSWETDRGRYEPEHRANFLASRLPAWPKSALDNDASNKRLQRTRVSAAVIERWSGS